MEQEIRFCTTSDGVRICYATVGQGPPLVKAPNWLTHLEFEWKSPVWRHWWEELAKDRRVVRFDQRGSGLSDRSVEDLSFGAWVSDLESVVDDVGLDRFALLGISQGGAVAVEYAVRHPERVSHLILYGAYPRGRAKRGGSLEEHEAMLTLTRRGWGRDNPAYRQLFTSQFMPGATAEQMSWFNELQRVSTSPENAARLLAEGAKIDVLHRLAEVSVPTLVLHGRDDVRVPFEQGRQLAALIPNAHFVPLESANHLLIETEPAWQTTLSEVRSFLGVSDEDRSSAPGPASGQAAVARPPAAAYPDGLTEREVQVLRLIAAGKSNPQIGRELFISAKTVGNHVSNILNKTGTSSRSEVAAYAVRQSLA